MRRRLRRRSRPTDFRCQRPSRSCTAPALAFAGHAEADERVADLRRQRDLGRARAVAVERRRAFEDAPALLVEAGDRDVARPPPKRATGTCTPSARFSGVRMHGQRPRRLQHACRATAMRFERRGERRAVAAVERARRPRRPRPSARRRLPSSRAASAGAVGKIGPAARSRRAGASRPRRSRRRGFPRAARRSRRRRPGGRRARPRRSRSPPRRRARRNRARCPSRCRARRAAARCRSVSFRSGRSTGSASARMTSATSSSRISVSHQGVRAGVRSRSSSSEQELRRRERHLPRARRRQPQDQPDQRQRGERHQDPGREEAERADHAAGRSCCASPRACGAA